MVKIRADGNYTVLLGAGSSLGLPQGVFASAEARWLGVRAGDDDEQPRVLLSSVPYALKAADAETLAGRAAADYVTREDVQSTVAATVQTAALAHPEASPTGSGTTGYVPLWTGTSTLGNSVIAESGTKVGIGTAAPLTTLDVNGASTLRQSVSLPAAAATSTAGGNSPALELGASTFSSTSKAAVAQSFAWQAASSGNNTASPTARLELLFASGSAAAAATGLYINPNGQINFAAGQKFPGTGAGTITGVTAGSGLKGGGTTGAVSLAVDPTAVATLAASNTFSGAATTFANGVKFEKPVTFASGQTFPGAGSGTITGVTAGTGLTGGGTTGTVTLAVNNNVVPELSTNNVFIGPDTFNAGLTAKASGGGGAVAAFGSSGIPGVYGVSDTGPGGYFVNNTTASSAVYAVNIGTGNPGLVIAVKGVVPNATSIAVLGKALGDNSWGVFGENVGGQDSWGVYGSTTGAGSTAVYGKATGGADVNNNFVSGVVGVSANGSGVVGSSLGSSSVAGTVGPEGTWGVWGDNGGSSGVAFGAGVLGTAGNNLAGFFENNSGNDPTINVFNDGSNEAANFNTNYSGGPALMANNGGGGYAAELTNDSPTYPTLYLSNNGGGPITDGIFKSLMASTPTGTCGIGGNGDLSCTGQMKSLVSTGGGARRVETYSVQSPENWMEDFGSGTLVRGVAVVKIDTAFAETVSATADYHVFLTPKGDSKGLYVINETAAGFEVRESGGGTSSLAFDYRIVAKRRGYEAQRLKDVTESFNAAKSAAERQASPHPAPRPLRKPVQPETRQFPNAAAIAAEPEMRRAPVASPNAKPRPSSEPRP